MRKVVDENYVQLTIYSEEIPVSVPTFAEISSSFIYEFGADATQLVYLLGVIIGGRNKVAAENLSAQGIHKLMEMTERDFLREKGIGRITAARLAATFSIARRVQTRTVTHA